MPSMLFETDIVSLASDLVTDTTGTTTTLVADMQGYDEIEFRIWHGDVDPAAVMVYTLYENTANSTSGGTAVTLATAAGTGASISSGTLTITESSGNLDDKCIRVGASHLALSKRYVYLTITATVESYEVDKIECVRRKARNLPITDSSDVAAVGYVGK